MDVDYERKRRSAQKKKRRRQQELRRRILFVLVALLVIVLITAFALNRKKVNTSATLEAGEELTLDLFVEKDTADAVFITDVAGIDTTVPGEYEIIISYRGKEYTCGLTIEDTIAPKADAFMATTNVGEVPDAAACVINVTDVTDVAISYKNEPDVSQEGEIQTVVRLTDEGGNTTEIEATIVVVGDNEPPVIEGAADINVFLGDTVSYKANITVTDDKDENPTLEVDNSQVDLNTVGTYEVIYTATDAAGNSSSVTVNLTISDKPASYVEPEVVYEMAEEILSQITNDSMSDMEKAFAIYRWVNTHISYTGTSDKSSWTIGAYQAFQNRSGDCYNYYAAAKALFDVAGILNVDVVKSDTSHSSHYWSLINLGDGWYHLDCTPRKGDGDNFFMVTDAELEAYSVEHDNSHVFDSSLYPERATESVQDKVDYVNGVVYE